MVMLTPRTHDSLRVPQAIVVLRQRRSTLVVVALAAALAEAVILIAGGPPTAWTHLFYFVVLAVAVLWGRWWGITIGFLGGVLVGPVAQALASSFDADDASWLIRAAAMMLVGWSCGALAHALMHELEQLERVNREMALAFVRAIDARDPNTARHSELVAAYAAALAAELGMEPVVVARIHQAALLHDVGKIALERSVLQKPGALSDAEWVEVRAHPVMSEHILRGVHRFRNFLAGARHHHERYDGAGYPDGLAGEQIPLDARVIAVCDAYEAMTSDRAYRSACSEAEARTRLQEGAGTQFDPGCVAAFMRLDLSAVGAGTAADPVEARAALTVETAAILLSQPAAQGA
jgi:putative nucleotidyltransferase with HDIG domain